MKSEDIIFSLEEKFEELDRIGERAFQLICAGKLDSAKRVLSKLDRTPYISEAEQIKIPLLGIILLKQNKKRKAKELILESISYLWNSPDGLYILRASNPHVNEGSNFYHLKIKGGRACLGMFTQFSENHIASFDVLADSESEALTYIEEICKFSDSSGKQILECTPYENPPEDFDRKGIYRCYPFELAEAGSA